MLSDILFNLYAKIKWNEFTFGDKKYTDAETFGGYIEAFENHRFHNANQNFFTSKTYLGIILFTNSRFLIDLELQKYLVSWTIPFFILLSHMPNWAIELPIRSISNNFSHKYFFRSK